MIVKDCKPGDLIVVKYYDAYCRVGKYICEYPGEYKDVYSYVRCINQFNLKDNKRLGEPEILYTNATYYQNKTEVFKLETYDLKESDYDYVNNINLTGLELLTNSQAIIQDEICWSVNKLILPKVALGDLNAKFYATVKSKVKSILKKNKLSDLNCDITLDISTNPVKYNIVLKDKSPPKIKIAAPPPKMKTRFELIKL